MSYRLNIVRADRMEVINNETGGLAVIYYSPEDVRRSTYAPFVDGPLDPTDQIDPDRVGDA